jgi:hypothetical protein
MKFRALSCKTRFENQNSPKYLGFEKMDKNKCPIFQTPVTFGQKK